MKKTFYHPKCRDISGTIEKLNLTADEIAQGMGQFEIIDSFGFEEWLDTEEESIEYLNKCLENDFNGSTSQGMADDRAYAAAERFACGG